MKLFSLVISLLVAGVAAELAAPYSAVSNSLGLPLAFVFDVLPVTAAALFFIALAYRLKVEESYQLWQLIRNTKIIDRLILVGAVGFALLGVLKLAHDERASTASILCITVAGTALLGLLFRFNSGKEKLLLQSLKRSRLGERFLLAAVTVGSAWVCLYIYFSEKVATVSVPSSTFQEADWNQLGDMLPFRGVVSSDLENVTISFVTAPGRAAEVKSALSKLYHAPHKPQVQSDDASRHLAASGTEASSLSGLTQLPSKSLAGVPITRANLLCTEGLSNGGASDIPAAEATVRSWAEHVQSETERHWYRFQQRPDEYENSPGFFRMLMLAVVLAEDYNIHYDEARKGGPESTRTDDGFFSQPESVFLSGLLGPEHKGTCSSMPVLYVAIGRELGYPLKLVTTKGHLFVRWEGDGERFNVEATSHGLNRFDDDYYRHWPFEVTQSEEAAEGYLKSLSPTEELAAFLSIRGMCLRALGRAPEASDAFAAAARLAPHCRSYRQMHESLRASAGRAPAHPSFLTNQSSL